MRLIKICLLLLTIFTANFAFAGEPAPNLPDSPKLKIIQGGGGYFPAAANDAKYGIVVTDGAKVAKIIPSVVKVASFASRASNAIGLVQLAYEGIMSGVDYVLDPANNQVRWTKSNPGYCYNYNDFCQGNLFPTWQEAVTGKGINPANCRVVGSYHGGDYIKCTQSGNYEFMQSLPVSGTAPLSNVATNLQDKANAGNAAAQTLIDQVVQDMINKNDDEILTALKSPQAVPYVLPVTNPSTNPDGSPNPAYNPQKDPYGVPLPVTNPVTNPDGSPNPAYNPQKDPYGVPLPVTNPATNPDGSPNPAYNPQKDPYGVPLPVTNPSTNPDGSPSSGSKSFELPAFCSWASAVCEWQDWTKSEYKDAKDGVQKAYKDMHDWFTKEPEPDDTDNKIKPDDDVDWQSKANTNYVTFGGSCPAPVSIPINYMGASTNLEISYMPFCRFAELIRPAVIMGAWISALMIISGGRSKE